jgi:mRNA-degrading endonuclease YafQ of YafQ-DinJ toxin-antitoxin module
MHILNTETLEKSESFNYLSLYDQDFMLWIENTVQLLRNQRLTELDLENLIDEVEDMGKNQKHALESNLNILCNCSTQVNCLLQRSKSDKVIE